ncbi:neuronal acetylcholine receptor subunit alpha-5-like isoform X2 [Periplaneta americana]|uniref:neuronal acetylcholine receptor subunit alpha-5-like isoform X2 n=1 Tax=Periplaneta americana TaxID=6978 RepID=UPI0037E85806
MIGNIFILWIFCFVTLIGKAESNCNSGSKPKSAEYRLKRDLLCNYDKTVRPVRVKSDQTRIAIDLTPISMYFEESADVFVLHASVNLMWRDEFLAWNMSDYGGVKTILIDSDSIWVPDVYHMSTSWWDFTSLRSRSKLCSVKSPGFVHCWADHDLLALCYIDLRNWPFDTQNCTVSLSTLMQSSEEIVLLYMEGYFNLEQYIPNRQWTLLDRKFMSSNMMYGDKVYPNLQFSFLLKRNAAISEVAIIVPTTVLVVLTLASIWLGTDHEVRLNLCCTLVLVNSLVLQDIGNMTDGDKAPQIVLFLRDCLVMCVLALELAVFNQWATTSSSSVPRVINFFLESDARQLLLMSRRLSHPKNCEKLEEENDEVMNDTVAKEMSAENKRKWKLFGELLDRTCFVVFILTYFVLICVYIF